MADEIASLYVRIDGDVSGLERAISAAERELAGLEKTQSKGNTNTSFEKTASKAEKAGKKLQSAGKGMQEFASGLDTVTKPVQYVAMGLAAGGVASAKFAMDFEDNFANVKKTVEGTPEQLENVKKGIIDLSTSTPITTAELTELAAAGGQLGIQTDNIVGFTEVMAQLGTATNLSGAQGAATLARFTNVANISQSEVSNLGSTVVDLGNNFATSEAEIADMALQMGATGSVVGISAQDVLAYSTALSSMGVEAEAGGSAVSRIWMDMQTAVSSGGEDLSKFAKLSGKSSKEFSEQWKTDASGAFQEFLKGLNESEDQVKVLSDLGFNNVRDIQALQRLAGEKGFGLLIDAIQRSNKAWEENTALQNEFDAKLKTTKSQIDVAKNNIVEAGRSIGESFLPYIAEGSVKVKEFAQHIANMSSESKTKLIDTAGKLVAVGAGAKVITGTVSGVGKFVEGVGKIAPAAGIAAKAIGAVGLGITAVAAAVGIGAVAYKKYKDSQIDWSDGMQEAADAMNGHLTQWKELNGLQWERKQLKLTIESDTASKEEIEAAQRRLAEIDKILQEKYNLDISVSDAQLNDALDKLREAKKTMSELEAYELKEKIVENAENLKNNDKKKAKAERDIKEAQERADKAKAAQEKIKQLKDDYAAGAYDGNQIQYFKDLNQALSEANPDFYITSVSKLGKAEELLAIQFKSTTEEVSNKKKELLGYDESAKEATATAKEFANAQIDFMRDDIANGVDPTDRINDIEMAVKTAGLSVDEYAKKTAAAQTGVSGLSSVWEQGGDVLDNYVDSYINLSTQFGAASKDTAINAALIQEGFTSVEQAANAGALEPVFNSFKQFGDELGLTAAEIATVAVSMGLIPEGKHIEITAEGDISLIDNAKEETEGIDGTSATIILDADGNPAYAIINGVTSRLGDYDEISGTATLYGDNGQALATVDVATGKVISFDGITATANIKAEDQTGPGVASAKENLKTVKDKVVKITVRTNFENQTGINPGDHTFKPIPKATGTQNFPGGLAMINDQRGVADPRELVEHKGKRYLFEGRDVVLPLDKGDKVYTAAQTKSILGAIPHFAGGKDNSDAFTSARDDWEHYTSTHAVSVSEELQKWLEFSAKFKDNQQDVRDIQEKIYDLTCRQNDEANEMSKSWMAERAALNDWSDFGDSALEAYARVDKRNYQAVQDMKQTWADYREVMKDLGMDMYDDWSNQANKQLEQQRKYNHMSTDAYIAELDKQLEQLEEFYRWGAISRQQYEEGRQDLENKKTDAKLEKLAKGNDESIAWIKQRTYFNDWGAYGDDPIAAYDRVKQRNLDAFNNGEIDYDQYVKYNSEAGSELFSGRFNQSKNWLDEQVKYFGMNEQDYLAGLDRMQKYTDEYYAAGIISHEEYNEACMEIDHSRYDEVSKLYDDQLSKAQNGINELRDQYSNQLNELRNTWSQADRMTDISETAEKLGIFRGAVTARGQKQYKEYQDQLKQLERDEELYQLEISQNETIKAMEEQYKRMEEKKADMLLDVHKVGTDIAGYVGDILSMFEKEFGSSSSSVINNNTTTYSDNSVRNVVVNDDVEARHFIDNSTNVMRGRLT